MSAIKETFIRRALEDYFRTVETAMRREATRLKVGVTGEGIRSLSHKVLQQKGGAMGTLSFYNYLRFVDMGASRGHPLGGLEAMKVKLEASNTEGYAKVKRKGRKRKKIYAKPAYGQLGHLYGKLLYGFTKETMEMLKTELKKSN